MRNLPALLLFVIMLSANCRLATATMTDIDKLETCRFGFDDDPLPGCLITNGGQTVVAPLYRSRLDFSVKSLSPKAAKYGLAVVFLPDGFGYANRQGRIVIRRVAEFDNGPADFIDGVVRVYDGAKVNYATTAGRLIFPSSFDWGSKFWHGRAYACIGCREICHLDPPEWGNCEDIDLSHVGGQWFRLEPKGLTIPIPAERMYKWMFDPGVAVKPTFHRLHSDSGP